MCVRGPLREWPSASRRLKGQSVSMLEVVSHAANSDRSPVTHRYPLDDAPFRTTAKLHEYVDRLRDIMAYVGTAQGRAGLQHQQHELLDRGFRRIRVDRGHRAGMPGIDRAQK